MRERATGSPLPARKSLDVLLLPRRALRPTIECPLSSLARGEGRMAGGLLCMSGIRAEASLAGASGGGGRAGSGEGSERLGIGVRQALICSCCDRGQIYCAGDCAARARRRRERDAGRRYQTSRRGRLAHAERTRRYRVRRKNVTHHGSPASPPDDLLSSGSLAIASDASAFVDRPRRRFSRCDWCGGAARISSVKGSCGGRQWVPRHDRMGRGHDDAT